jgi:hypothetical protein
VTVESEGSTAWLWTGGSQTELSGLQGMVQTAGWLDEDYAVVTSGEARGTTVYLCPVADRSCTPVAFSETDVRLAE